MRFTISTRYKMKNYRNGMYERNEGQDYIMAYFEWQLLELVFCSNDNKNS